MKLRYIYIIVLCILTSGCNYLDIMPDERAKLEDSYNTPSKTEGFLYSCYTYMPMNRSSQDSQPPLCHFLLVSPFLPVCLFCRSSALSRFRKRLRMQPTLRRLARKPQSSTAFSFPNSVASMSSVSQYFRM